QRGAAPGGVGHGLVRLPGDLVVAALAVVNAAGRVVGSASAAEPGDAGLNTTLAVVVTNARLDVATATRTAAAGHDGLARAIEPVHTLGDGDTVFCLATGAVPPSAAAPDAPPGWPGAARVAGTGAVQSAAAEAVRLAVLDAVR
ncbi:P1 family peptidase, partial [Angustibacter speluncae]